MNLYYKAMQHTKDILSTFSQHEKLAIKVTSNNRHNDLPKEVFDKLVQPHKIHSYLFVFAEHGTLTYGLDMEDIALTDGQFLFALPNQILTPPASIDPEAIPILLNIYFTSGAVL